MIYIDRNSYVLTVEEYNKITNPDVTYTLMTKSSANKAVDNILKYTKEKCWQDSEDDMIYCSECPVMIILGEDAGSRMCLRQKRHAQ